MGTLCPDRIPMGNPLLLHEDCRRVRCASSTHRLRTRIHRLAHLAPYRSLSRRTHPGLQTLEDHRDLWRRRDGDPVVPDRVWAEGPSFWNNCASDRDCPALRIHLRLLLW